jgi:SAM-dependent methyltransferase
MLRRKIERFIYRRYRSVKASLLWSGKAGFFSRIFFRLLKIADVFVSPRKPAAKTSEEERIWRMLYFNRFREPQFRIHTDYPVASDSADHKWPRGTLYDNSVNRNFNPKAYVLCGLRSDFSLMDLGCAGGGLVRTVIEDGFTAVGLEGSDISKKLRAGEWGNIPNHLYTCDITRPFSVAAKDETPAKFNMITAWEVLEHVAEERIPTLLDNIRRHLRPDGYFVGSVDSLPDGNPVTGAIYHVTLKGKAWWIARFNEAGFEEVTEHPFETQDYVRGNGLTIKDWDPKDGGAFHLVMKLKAPSLGEG